MDWRRSDVREGWDSYGTRCVCGRKLDYYSYTWGNEGFKIFVFSCFFIFIFIFFFDHYFRSSLRLILHRLANEPPAGWMQCRTSHAFRWESDFGTHGRGIINIKRSVKKFKIAQRFLGMGVKPGGRKGKIPLCDGSFIPSPPCSWAPGWQASNRRRNKERFDCRENPSASSPYNIVHCVQTPSRPWRWWFAIPGCGAYCQDLKSWTILCRLRNMTTEFDSKQPSIHSMRLVYQSWSPVSGPQDTIAPVHTVRTCWLLTFDQLILLLRIMIIGINQVLKNHAPHSWMALSTV